MQGLSPTQRSAHPTPSRDLTLGVVQLATLRSPGPREAPPLPNWFQGANRSKYGKPHRRGEPRSRHPPSKGNAYWEAPEGPLGRTSARRVAIPLIDVFLFSALRLQEPAQTRARMHHKHKQARIVMLVALQEPAQTQARMHHKHKHARNINPLCGGSLEGCGCSEREGSLGGSLL